MIPFGVQRCVVSDSPQSELFSNGAAIAFGLSVRPNGANLRWREDPLDRVTYDHRSGEAKDSVHRAYQHLTTAADRAAKLCDKIEGGMERFIQTWNAAHPDQTIQRCCGIASTSACLRYTMNAIVATGLSSESVKEEFDQHAKEERGHMREVAERINQLGGKPDFNPEGLASRSASQYTEGGNLVEMIRENLIAERIACEHYRELIRYFADKDPTTRVMLEGILVNEEEHANDMHDLLVAHEGKPMLSK